MSNWSRLLNLKGPGTYSQSSKSFKTFHENIALACIYQLTKFGGLVVFKRYIWMHPVSCANTHHDVTDLVNYGMVKNTKTWISWERNITFLWIEKDLNLCLRWHILSCYCFVAEVTLYHQMYHQLWHQCFTYIFHNKIQCKLHL